MSKPKMNKKDWRIAYISCLIWVVICGLFSLAGPEYYLLCLIGAASFVIPVLAYSLKFDYLAKHEAEITARKNEKEKREQEKNEQFKYNWQKIYKPAIKTILRVGVCVIAVLLVISAIKNGASSFIEKYGMVPFLLLLILLFK